MSSTSHVETPPVGSSVKGFDAHVEELRAFFRTREMAFGSPADLKPFVERLDSDANFRDEIASMVRTIIYRERDGVSWAELMEVLAVAAGGREVDNATEPEVREAARKLMLFVENVFRTRRNPGVASEGAAERAVAPEPIVRETAAVEAAHPGMEASHPAMDVFYRARMAAQEEGAEELGADRRPEPTRARIVDDAAVEPETVLHTSLREHVPFEDFEDRDATERGSPAWLWVAGICALLLAFCAGLFVHQRLMVPLRDPGTPYQAPPPEATQAPNASAQPAAASTPQQTPQTVEKSMAAKHAPVVKAGAANAAAGALNDRPRYMAPATMGASSASMEGRLVYAPAASYPMMAEMTRVQGRVVVEAVVGKDGQVIRAKAISGHHLLRGAAVREVMGRRYRPYMVNDRPVDVATLVSVEFRLKR